MTFFDEPIENVILDFASRNKIKWLRRLEKRESKEMMRVSKAYANAYQDVERFVKSEIEKRASG